ncbi:MAG TPA: tetratricopeptide repeat protein [Bacteroidia bacterium]|nr:tetratricopeptide repeat protein [Bacteroidia bacterium]
MNRRNNFKKIIYHFIQGFKTRGVLFVLFFLVIIFFIVQCNTRTSTAIVESKTYASLHDTVKYVGINTCRQCHESIYETFIHTGMGSSFDVASKKKSAAKFDGHALIYDKDKDFYYKAFWENDSLKFMEFRLQGKDTVHKRIETVTYIVGSGQHTNSHIMNTNGYLNQAPMTFYTQKGHWDLPPGFENGGNSRFSRLIGLECMSCHNGYPEFVMGSENKYEKIQTGIDCERCHGPGEKHVADKRAGKILDVSKEIDYSIVNPAKLPIALQLDICQRCHIQGNTVLNEEKSFFDFRPGMHLSEVMNVFMPVYAGRTDEHIMASHAERLKMSRCYTESLREVEKNNSANTLRPYEHALTCVTCHNPHVSVRVTENTIFNNACKNCHTAVKHNECTEKPALLVKEQHNCVKCHMVNSGATDIPHVRVTDHFIRVPVQDTEVEKLKKFIGIACINNPVPPDESKGKAFIAYYEKFNYDKSVLDSALKYFSDKTKDDIRKNFSALVQIYFLKNDYSKIIYYANQLNDALSFLSKKSFSNSDSWTCYRVGESYEYAGEPGSALKFYERATDLAPYELDFQNKYGTLLMQSGNTGKAKKVFEFIISQYPKHAAALSNLGYIYLATQGDTIKARELYEKAIALDPDYWQAWYNKAGLYAYQKNFMEAKKILNFVLKRNPSDEKAKQILNSINSL